MLSRIVLLLFFIGVFSAYSQNDEQRKIAKEVAVTSGVVAIFDNLVPMLIQNFKKQYPEVTEDVWIELLNELKVDALTDSIVSIYCRHYTTDELKKMIEWNKSEVGMKQARLQSKISDESMKAGQRVGAELGMQVIRKMLDKGYNHEGKKQ